MIALSVSIFSTQEPIAHASCCRASVGQLTRCQSTSHARATHAYKNVRLKATEREWRTDAFAPFATWWGREKRRVSKFVDAKTAFIDDQSAARGP